MGKGYVRIHREIMDHWLWEDKPYSKGQAWIDLILRAKYKDEKFPYRDNVIDGKRGTVYISIKSLANEWGWSRDKTTRFLMLLQADGMIVLNATKHNTTITLVNYGLYQDPPATNKATNRQQTGNRPTTSRQQTDIYNKENKDLIKRNKEKKETASLSENQTLEEIEEATNWFESIVED